MRALDVVRWRRGREHERLFRVRLQQESRRCLGQSVDVTVRNEPSTDLGLAGRTKTTSAVTDHVCVDVAVGVGNDDDVTRAATEGFIDGGRLRIDESLVLTSEVTADDDLDARQVVAPVLLQPLPHDHALPVPVEGDEKADASACFLMPLERHRKARNECGQCGLDPLAGVAQT